MSNDELMTKREMARGEQGAAVSCPPSLGSQGAVVSFYVGLTTRHGPPKPQLK
jgi:hypothetical protein